MKAVITDYQYEDIAQEREIIRGAGIALEEYQIKEPKRLIGLVDDADAIVTQYSDINADVIEHLKHCKMIIKYGIGVNNIDVDAATKKGIYVCNVPDYGVEEVSDHAIALMLAMVKKLATITDALKGGDWGYSSIVPLYRFSEATVGLVGFGRIPQLVARKLSGFGVKILAYDPFINMEQAERLNVTSVPFETLCRESDYISIHCPLSKETTHLFNRATFAMMKNTAVLINTARGGVVEEAALIEALEKRIIAGAGLDVFENEPVDKENPLLHMDHVIATPHCAWYSIESINGLQRKVAEEVVNILQGNEPFHCVNYRELRNKS
ncbi:C-terminal binding protein [Lachnospiraceae bacterium 62-35]